MKQHFYYIAIGIILLFAFSAGCSKGAGDKTAGKPGDYFPLVLGNRWEYAGKGNEYASFTREVIFTEGNRAQVQENNGGTVMAFVFETTDNAVTRVFSREEVYDRINLLNSQPNENIAILKSPLAVGSRWAVPTTEREIVDVSATVDTPAGKFEGCIKIKAAGPDSTVYEYYKDGVGLVKREFVAGDTRVTSSLKKFIPGKDSKIS